MDRRTQRNKKSKHVSMKQKLRLTELLMKYPLLLQGKFTNEFNVESAQRLWQQIAKHMNAIPGSWKTWREWRKTWQDLYSKYKKKQKREPDVIPLFVQLLTPAGQKLFGYENVPIVPNKKALEFLSSEKNTVEIHVDPEPTYQETSEFVPLDINSMEVLDFCKEIESAASSSEAESPPKKKRRHPSVDQKVRLMEFLAKQPLLVRGKFTKEFTYDDARGLWQEITRELNTLPGARKSWMEWRKTWQDYNTTYKKRQKTQQGIPTFVSLLSPAGQALLGFKDLPSASTDQGTTEYVSLETKNMGSEQNCQETDFMPIDSNCMETIENDEEENNFDDESDSADSLSEPESPPETKVFAKPFAAKFTRSSTRHSESCAVNCSKLVEHEERDLDLKQDFINFKKDYLRRKLQIMQEQTEALKAIARELGQRGTSGPGENAQ